MFATPAVRDRARRFAGPSSTRSLLRRTSGPASDDPATHAGRWSDGRGSSDAPALTLRTCKRVDGHGQADGRRGVFASRVRAVPIIVHEPARSHRGPAGYERRGAARFPRPADWRASQQVPARSRSGLAETPTPPSRAVAEPARTARARLATTASMPPGPASAREGTRRSRRCAPCRAAPTRGPSAPACCGCRGARPARRGTSRSRATPRPCPIR